MANNNMNISDDVMECGIIMPISTTQNFDSNHWADVQTLHHRAVKRAGMNPKNVWTGSSSDRITPRILGNLFQVPIAICDITDLNPNVMIELGMRLTSKKPTVVVSAEGGKIPFDINDFEVLFYPKNLSILGMEKYFDQVKFSLEQKITSYLNDQYQPFLHGFSIEVLEPNQKEMPIDNLILSRLDKISSEIRGSKSQNKTKSFISGQLSEHGTTHICIKPKRKSDLETIIAQISDKFIYRGYNDGSRYLIPFGLGTEVEEDLETVSTLIEEAGIEADVTLFHEIDEI